MYCVSYDEGFGKKFFKTKANAVKCALQIFNQEFNDYCEIYNNGNIEETIEEVFEDKETFEACIEEIKAGDFEDDWVAIFEIETAE